MALTGRATEADAIPGTYLACGFAAGAAAGALTCPVDVVKTRIQVGGGGDGSSSGSRRGSSRGSSSGGGGGGGSWKTLTTTVSDLWKAEGPAGFARGITARTLWLAPGSAIGIAAYEWAKVFLLDDKEGGT